MKHRILLVDDEDDILEFLGYNLLKAGYEVSIARSGDEALEVAALIHPHLIILDRMMNGMDGIETCRRLREIKGLEHVMILFLSALGEEHEQVEGYDAGADDYIAKPIRLKVLMSRVAAILKRIDAGGHGRVRIDTNLQQVFLDGVQIALTRKEYRLLLMLYAHPGVFYTREQILELVWGGDVMVGDRTIDVHIRKLRQKIGDQHIQTFKGVGYTFIP
ncbi:MAG: response regulator transcription factor [Rikenellaceae bacterium]|nr:response regulator transcription factor [Rikenellaceae bacterium]